MAIKYELGQIPQKEYAKYKNKSLKEIQKICKKDLYKIGSYKSLLPIHIEKELLDKCTSFFSFDSFLFFETYFKIIDKNILKEIINHEHYFISENLKKIQENVELQASYIKEKVDLWIWCKNFNITPYYLDNCLDSDNIIWCEYIEYKIFDLVRIYRTFNWEKNVLICCGY